MLSENLARQKIMRRPSRVSFTGRTLFLTEDPDLIRLQIAGEDLEMDQLPLLRNDISTDEITPSQICIYFDERLGEFVYTGLRCGAEFPVKRREVSKGGFSVSVAGKRRGKGSSREHSPYAEIAAGIKLVIGESFERIYQQNCQNLGLLTSTDFSLLPRIARGEPIALKEFTNGKDEITRQIIEHGGLFPYNLARLQGRVGLPHVTTSSRPMTLAEKILAKHLVTDLATDQVGVIAVKPGDTGFVRADLRFSHEYVTPMAARLFERFAGDASPNDPSSIYFFRDHLPFFEDVATPEHRAMGLPDLASQLKLKQEEFSRRHGIRLHGDLADRKGSDGISHNLILQHYALPGQVIIGSDSHTPQAGAVSCLAVGVGSTELFNSWITKDIRICVPKQANVRISGAPPANVTAKDLMLAILRTEIVRSGELVDSIVEYTGEAVSRLSIDERATLTNMAAEVGAFTGIVATDEKTIAFLVARGLPRSEAERLCENMTSDPQAKYAFTLHINASEVRPMVATPGDPSNGLFVDELPSLVKVDIAYGGSCTASKKEDLDMYARVFREALARGQRVHPTVECFIQCGSQFVRSYCEQQGYLKIFQEVGARLVEPGCGACINAGPGASTSPHQIVISAQNRNFPGRSGPGQMYLASPYTVAASSIAGYIVEYKTNA